MKTTKFIYSVTLVIFLGISSGASWSVNALSTPVAEQAEPEKGPNGGRVLREDNIALELAIFETGVPPEFRIWLTQNGKPIDPKKVKLNIKLTRLDAVVDDIKFKAQSDFLSGDMEIYEPHSFTVTVIAEYEGEVYRWEYDNFEGRTRIEPAVAEALEIKTHIAGPETIHQSMPAYGQLWLPPSAHRRIFARFEGVIKDLKVKLGDRVEQGQVLMVVESNKSLKPFNIKSPISGFVSKQLGNTGEQTSARELLSITDPAQFIAKLAIYPSDYSKVKQGTPVSLRIEGIESDIASKVSFIEPQVRNDQARIVWVKLPNMQERLLEGSFVKAEVETATFEVPLAVNKAGLQSFRDFTVVYAKVGDEYEVRMLELGRSDSLWIEVLGGLKSGTEYVTENSYIIKADIEKSGASHDH
jgi:cobalt-zinc-cadmium efflux system membrane fusion protein